MKIKKSYFVKKKSKLIIYFNLPEIIVLDGVESEVLLLVEVPEELNKLFLHCNISSPIHVLRYREVTGEKYSSIVQTFHFICYLEVKLC